MSQTPTKILLVEDNPADARLLLEMLAEVGSHASGIELVEVPRLAAAIQRLQDANFDLVLLDLSLPDSQGVATVDRVKDARPNVPIVVLTNQDDDNIAAEALRRGAQDHLVKDQIDRRMLMRAIRYPSSAKSPKPRSIDSWSDKRFSMISIGPSPRLWISSR